MTLSEDMRKHPQFLFKSDTPKSENLGINEEAASIMFTYMCSWWDGKNLIDIWRNHEHGYMFNIKGHRIIHYTLVDTLAHIEEATEHMEVWE